MTKTSTKYGTRRWSHKGYVVEQAGIGYRIWMDFVSADWMQPRVNTQAQARAMIDGGCIVSRHLYIPSFRRRDEGAEAALRIAVGGKPWLRGHVWPVLAVTVHEAAAELRSRGVPIATGGTVGWAIVDVIDDVRSAHIDLHANGVTS